MNLAGHHFDERELINRVMRNMRAPTRHGEMRWVLVRDIFGVGSTVAHAMCDEFGLDPDERVSK